MFEDEYGTAVNRDETNCPSLIVRRSGVSAFNALSALLKSGSSLENNLANKHQNARGHQSLLVCKQINSTKKDHIGVNQQICGVV